jgi:uncharacterized protein YbjT (DUF2867 family)
MTEQLILVTGATGKTGRRVVRRLEGVGVPVRVTSSRSELRFDWWDRSTWAPVLTDVTTVYLVVPHLGGPEAAEGVAAFAQQAAAAGVRRAVMVSFPDTGDPSYEHVLAAETAIAAASLESTVLRPRWFFQNFSEDFLRDAVMAGEIRLPAGDGREAFIDAQDIADVAVSALVAEGHAGQVYELSGPRLMSFADAASDLSSATGNNIGYVALSPEQYAAEQRTLAVPEDWIQLTIGLYAHVRDGLLSTITSDVEKVLGRQPRDFADYARNAAAEGAWPS